MWRLPMLLPSRIPTPIHPSFIRTPPLALSKVIMALQAKASHVPSRDSKLTYLLQHSLGGGARTLLVANVNPLHAHASETLCTLRFATAVANVR